MHEGSALGKSARALRAEGTQGQDETRERETEEVRDQVCRTQGEDALYYVSQGKKATVGLSSHRRNSDGDTSPPHFCHFAGSTPGARSQSKLHLRQLNPRRNGNTSISANSGIS